MISFRPLPYRGRAMRKMFSRNPRLKFGEPSGLPRVVTVAAPCGAGFMHSSRLQETSSMTNQEIYLARAAEARADAAAATLANVRERCLRAEEAWMAMAERAARTDRMRARTEAEKAQKAREQEPLLVQHVVA